MVELLGGLLIGTAISGVVPVVNAELLVLAAAATVPLAGLPLVVAVATGGQMLAKTTLFAVARWVPRQTPEKGSSGARSGIGEGGHVREGSSLPGVRKRRIRIPSVLRCESRVRNPSGCASEPSSSSAAPAEPYASVLSPWSVPRSASTPWSSSLDPRPRPSSEADHEDRPTRRRVRFLEPAEGRPESDIEECLRPDHVLRGGPGRDRARASAGKVP